MITRALRGWVGVVCLILGFAITGWGQSAAEPGVAAPAQTNTQAVVPHLIKFSGRLQNLAGKAIGGPVDVTFSLYSGEASATGLWFETQTVQADALGNYSVLLGAMTPAGVPMELFEEGQARWLGVQVSNLPEQPRVLLVSVPYAMKAGDAETLGGKPASAFLLASQAETAASAAATAGTLSGLVQASALTSTPGRTTPQAVTMTANYIPVFTDTVGGHGNSVMYQLGARIGIGTTAPSFGLDLNSNVFAIGTTTAKAGAGGTMRFRDDTGTVRWAFGIPGTAGATDFYLANPVNGRQPLYIQGGAGSFMLYLHASGTLGVGTNAPSFPLDVNGNVIGVGTKAASPGAGGTLRFRDDTGTVRWALGIPTRSAWSGSPH